MKSRCLAAMVGTAGLLFLSRPAIGKLVDCLSPHVGYKVFLSEPVWETGTFANVEEMRQTFLVRLQWQLDRGRDAKWIESPIEPVHFVLCYERKPRMDGGDFEGTSVQTLYNKNVLLEIWGSLKGSTT